MKDYYDFNEIAKKIVTILHDEEVTIDLLPEVFEAIERDIKKNTVPYKPS